MLCENYRQVAKPARKIGIVDEKFGKTWEV